MDAHEGEDAAPRSFLRRRLPALALIAVLVAAAAAAAALLSGSDGTSTDNEAFYAPPAPLPAGAPGVIIRSERIADPPPDSTAFRILYHSPAPDGRDAARSALVFVSGRLAPANGRNVVALMHGTVGVAPRCAVSRGEVFDDLDGLARFIRAGYVVVVPDLEGLTRAGEHPYLVGDAAAHTALDAVRATQRLQAAAASERFVAWGVGRGGQAALFTAQEAASYAPELELAGVAAGAPMANLGRLIETTAGTPAGDVMAAYTLSTWSRAFAQLRLDEILMPTGRAVVQRVSALCVPLDNGRIGPALGDRDVALAYRTKAPWNEGPWQKLLAGNSPGAKTIAVPVIITQGNDDGFVRPTSTARFVRYLCGRGTTVQYRPSAKVAHGDLGEKTAPYVSKWIAGRFAGDTARSTC